MNDNIHTVGQYFKKVYVLKVGTLPKTKMKYALVNI